MFTQVTNAEGQGDNSIQCHHTQPPGIFAQVLLAYASCQNHVKAPSMVGPTWTKVRFALGSDCLPALSQGTTSLLPHVSWTAYCLHAHDSMIWVIQGCISTLYLSMSPWGLFTTSYSVCLHGALYLMMDYYVYSWWRASKPASADVLQVSLQFLLPIATVLGSRYYGRWYNNIGRCGL